MKVAVIVTLKPTVLDPQGMTIYRNLESLGFSGIEGVRQGKYFEVELGDNLGEAERKDLVNRLASEVLTNPVIESFKVAWD